MVGSFLLDWCLICVSVGSAARVCAAFVFCDVLRRFPMENNLKRKRVPSEEELKKVHRHALSGHVQPLSVNDLTRPSSAPTVSTILHLESAAARKYTERNFSSADCVRVAPPAPASATSSSTDDQSKSSQYRAALNRLQELQDDLLEVSSMDSDDSELQDHLEGLSGPARSRLDPEALGFLVCAQETMKYLNEQGIRANDPMIVNLRNRFVNGLNRLGID